MVKNAEEIYSQAEQFSDDDDLYWRWPVEYHEANMKQEGISGKNSAVDSHLFLFETDQNSQKSVELHDH